jgi:hypothetical protein
VTASAVYKNNIQNSGKKLLKTGSLPDQNNINNMFVLDDAQCTLHTNVNSQNNRYWCTKNPPYVCEVPLHDKVQVWCAVSAYKIKMAVLKK